MPGCVIYKKGCTRLAAASNKAYQLLVRGRWFSTGNPASSTTKTGHDIAELLLKVALNTNNQIKSICVTNDHGYVPFVTNTPQSFHHSWLISVFVSSLTRRVPLVEQELFTISEHRSWTSVFSGVRVTRSLPLYVCFIDLFFGGGALWCYLSFFDLRILITTFVSSNTA